MRVYALLLGLALTAGSGYTAQVAVSSARAGAHDRVVADTRAVDEKPDVVWFGGTLDPVTVEAKSNAPARTAVDRRLILDRPPARCSHVNRSALL